VTVPFFFLPVDKPVGWTSHDAVARVRKLCRDVFPKKTKVGHTGTLDPFASGLLLLAIGKATRFSDDIHSLPKKYLATMTLGAQTDTLDIDGKVTQEKDIPEFTQQDLKKLELVFSGDLQQIPPQFSAKKVDGIRSYTLARRGEDVPLKPKLITIHNLALRKLDDKHIQIEVNCSTGTYIRSLARDLAAHLGTLGYLKELRRISLGSVQVDQAFSLNPSSEESSPPFTSAALPVSTILPSWPELHLPPDYLPDLIQGRTIHSPHPLPARFLGIIEQEGSVSAIFKCIYDPFLQLVQPKMLCYRRPAHKF
jgi:tRNA pseudouridine55 synthase